MKNLTRPFGLALFFTICASVAHAGVNGSGGGEAVISPSGQVQLVDLLPSGNLPTEGMSSANIEANFFASNRFVKVIATEDPTFFTCAIQKMKTEGAPVFGRLEPLLRKLIPLRVEFRLPSVSGGNEFESLKLPMAASFSPRLSPALQEALASYVDGRLWISNRIASRLDARDQCGLAVHEGLRHLNFSNLLVESLTTTEVEMVTRLLMGALESTDVIAPVLAKLNNLNKTADDWGKLADKTFKASNDLDNLRLDQSKHFTEAEKEAMRKQAQALDSEADGYVANAIGGVLNEAGLRPMIESGIMNFQYARMIEGITRPAGTLKCYDVLRLKKGTHLSCR